MTHEPHHALDEQRQRLLSAKLGGLLDWKKPEIENAVGPYDPTPFDQFDARRLKIIAQCVDQLRRYTDEELHLLLADREDDDLGTLEKWRAFLRVEIAKIGRPPWYAGGFGNPAYVADFQYWCSMPKFTIDEAVLLSVGVDPSHFENSGLFARDTKDWSKLWPAIQFLMRRREQFRRQFDPYLMDDPVEPDEFLEWSERVDLAVHPEFTRLLKRFQLPRQAKTAAPNAPRQDKREVDTIAQLFTAMAIEAYGYRPDQQRSPVPKEIVDLAASMGLVISDDTVRKYLRLGASFISEDWNPNSD